MSLISNVVDYLRGWVVSRLKALAAFIAHILIGITQITWTHILSKHCEVYAAD